MLIAGYQSEADYKTPRVSSNSGDPRSEARKPRSSAEALGQVFTPMSLAIRMVEGLDLPSLGEEVRILDPCVGPNTFPQTLRNSSFRSWKLDAIDVDPRMCAETEAAADPRVSVYKMDYLARPLQQYDAAILNPPYVRQEWLRDKQRARSTLSRLTGFEIPGTSNLYVYFIVKTVAELREGGRMACIVYDSWQSTRFGRWLKDFLDQHCIWRSEAVADCPFEGRLIDATIIFATKSSSAPQASVDEAEDVTRRVGYAPVEELFSSRRGLRLKQSSFFMSMRDRKGEGSVPFVKKIARIEGLMVHPDHPEAALLVEKGEKNPRAVAEIERRLAKAKLDPAKNVSILTWVRERPTEWFFHRKAPSDVILFNYYLRHRPRHVINPSLLGYADNFYGLTPKQPLSAYAWFASLNSTASSIGILEKARNQGAGLAKLQLFEYREAQVIDIRNWDNSDITRLESLGRKLATESDKMTDIIRMIDTFIADVTGDPELRSPALEERYRLADSQAKRPLREQS